MEDKITAIRDIHFDAAHRLIGHEGKCRFIHGHHYTVELHAEAAGLDPLGRVIDFSVLKERVGFWLDLWWDHNIILSQEDQLLGDVIGPWTKDALGACYLPYNPTAENIGRYVLSEVCPNVLSGTGVLVVKVVVHETPNCRAEVTREPNVAR